MKTSSRLLLVFLPLSLTGTLLAQADTSSTNGKSHPRGGHRGSPIVRVLDADKNRELSAAEIAAASAAIRTLDTNKDGNVAADELRPARPADAPARPAPPADAPVRQRPVDPVMLALDADSDGSLSSAEINNAAVSLAALDANKDGKLTGEEFRPLPPEGSEKPTDKGGKRGPRPSGE
jgi:Ca2+-binding EF-hand superfamily protein